MSAAVFAAFTFALEWRAIGRIEVVEDMEQRTFNVWVIVQPAEDVRGQWVAHCLDFDVVSIGASVQDALEMVHEAACMVALHDLDRGKSPLDRRAPEELFGALYTLLARGEKLSAEQLKKSEREGRLISMATQFELKFVRMDHDLVPQSVPPFPMTIGEQSMMACG